MTLLAVPKAAIVVRPVEILSILYTLRV